MRCLSNKTKQKIILLLFFFLFKTGNIAGYKCILFYHVSKFMQCPPLAGWFSPPNAPLAILSNKVQFKHIRSAKNQVALRRYEPSQKLEIHIRSSVRNLFVNQKYLHYRPLILQFKTFDAKVTVLGLIRVVVEIKRTTPSGVFLPQKL